METSDSIERRCKQVKDSLYTLASTLLDETPPSAPLSRPRPVVETLAVERTAHPMYEDLPLSSARSSELLELRQLLDLEQGKTRRLTEQLHSQEATQAEMDRLMKELYQTIDDLKAQNESAKAEVARAKGVEQHCDALRKQITAFQSTVTQKERLLTQVDAERQELLSRNEVLRKKLGETAPASQAEERLQEEVRQLAEENEQLALTLKATSEESQRLELELRSASQRETASRKDFQAEISHLCEERDRLTRALAIKESEIRDLRGVLAEKEVDVIKRPEWVTREKDAIVPALLAMLGQRTTESILPTVESLLVAQKRGAGALQIVERIGKLIQDCAPKEASTAQLTAKQVWRWVRRLVEEYMSLKRKITDAQSVDPSSAIRVHDKE